MTESPPHGKAAGTPGRETTGSSAGACPGALISRIEQVRPHVWMLGFCALVLGLLFRGARPWVLALVCALFGLTHTAGWVAIPFAVTWSLAWLVYEDMGYEVWELAPAGG